MTNVQPIACKPLLLLGLAVTVAGCSSSENEYVPPPPPEVTVAHPVQLPVTPFLEENGVIEAVEEAEVRARVRGFVEQINFEPAQDVKQGDVLYQIESDQYEAEAKSAEAAVAAAEASISVANALIKTAEAEVKKTEQNLGREKSLLEQNASSQRELDAAVAAFDAATAAMESAKANVEAATAEKGRMVASLAQAQLDLNYTKVQSPITGRISITDVKTGNLVENGGQLATVVNRDQVFANFSISDRAMLRFMKNEVARLKPGETLKEPDWRKIPAFLRRESDEGFPFEGVLNYVDQEGIDADTGTLGIRAEFENRAGRLYPGLFVTVRMPTGEPSEAMLIPEYAIGRDQRGLYALIVNAEQKVERVAVSIGRNINGWSVVESGLTQDSRVVVDGIQRARPGLKVAAIDKQLEVDDQMLLRGLSPSGRADETESESAAPSTSAEE